MLQRGDCERCIVTVGCNECGSGRDESGSWLYFSRQDSAEAGDDSGRAGYRGDEPGGSGVSTRVLSDCELVAVGDCNPDIPISLTHSPKVAAWPDAELQSVQSVVREECLR